MIDLLVILVIGIFILIGYKSGFVKTVFDFVSMAVSYLATRIVYPLMSRAIFFTNVFHAPVKKQVIEVLHLEEIIIDNTKKAQNQLIESLNLPKFIIERLQENNNYEIYKILNVNSLADYIGGYIANLIVNIFVYVIVFALLFLIIKLIGMTFSFLKKTKIAGKLDIVLGLFFGLCKGVIVVWILFLFLTLFLVKNPDSEIITNLENSVFAIKLYEGNLLLKLITKIFK